MKRILCIILLLTAATFAQTPPTPKPLTQTEYVKMLYDLQKNPKSSDDIIEAVRSRGIAFELTDGLRGLTRTKSANNDELKRALEEAERRRVNPNASKPVNPVEAAGVFEKAREATLAALGDMPDFVVKQQIQRDAAFAGTNNFRNQDRLVVAVSYRSSGQEEYRILSLNGVPQPNSQKKSSYEETGGTSSTGEFVTVLAKIFKPESDTKYVARDNDLIRGRQTIVFDFEVTVDKAQQSVIASGAGEQVAITGMKGKVWVDRENFRVLRLESDATEIPLDFPIRTARRVIDYDWVKINDEKYLLPLLSDVRLTFRENSKVFETRNLIRFKDYQKYGSEVKILDDDEVEVKDPPQQ